MNLGIKIILWALVIFVLIASLLFFFPSWGFRSDKININIEHVSSPEFKETLCSGTAIYSSNTYKNVQMVSCMKTCTKTSRCEVCFPYCKEQVDG